MSSHPPPAPLGDAQKFGLCELLGGVFEASEDAVIAVDAGRRVVFFNAAAARQYRRSPEEALGRGLGEIFTVGWEDAAQEAACALALDEGGSWRGEVTHCRRDGQVLEVEASLSGLGSADAGGRGQLGIFRDISARKRAEARQDLGLLDTLLRTAPVGFCLLDRDLRFVQINERLAELNGLAAEAHIGRSALEVVPSVAEAALEVTRQILATGEAVRDREFPRYTPAAPGRLRHFNESWYPVCGEDGQIAGFGVIVEEVTERKRAEESLRESEARFRSTFHNAATPMCMTSPRGGYLAVNRAYCEMLGYSEAEVLERTFAALTHPEDRQSTAHEPSRRLLAGEIGAYRTEKRYVRKDGAIVWCDLSVSVVAKPDGSAAYFIAQAHDITARRQAAEALRRSEQLARSQSAEAEAALEALPANIALLDAQGVIVRVNKAWGMFAAENAGSSGATGLGVNYLEVCETARGEEGGPARDFAAGIRQVITGQCERFAMEYPCHSPGQPRWFMGHVTACRGGGAARIVVAHVDITGQKSSAEEIRLLNLELESRVVARTAELSAAVHALEAQIIQRRRLEREILEISEREQCRLGQDLHDGLGQELAGIALLGKALADKLKAQLHPMSAEAARIATFTKDTIASARRLAKGLYPIELRRDGLLVAVGDLALQTRLRLGIRCELRQTGAPPKISESVEIHLYRIVQESIGNAIKHGGAHHILIELMAGPGFHSLSITDDGQGFEQAARGKGMGLALMEYRARVIGAQLSISRPPGGGCRILCELPMGMGIDGEKSASLPPAPARPW